MAQPSQNKYAFVENTFDSDFNPGEPLGQTLYLEATTFEVKDDDKLSISYDNTTKLFDLFNSLANRYGWGRLVNKVKVGNDTRNILKSHRMI